MGTPPRRRGRGDDGISWDKINNCFVGTISLGHDGNGKRRRRTVRGKTKAEVKNKLDKLHDEINAGIRTPATYTVRHCVTDWLDSLELDPTTTATYRGQAEKWIYPKIGATKLKDFKATGRRRVLQGHRHGAQQGVVGEDQEHPGQVDPPSPEIRPHRPERSRACRSAAGPAGPPVARHDPRASRQDAQGRKRPHNRLRQGREGQQGPLRRDPRGHRHR
jgi:hypothetical protein